MQFWLAEVEKITTRSSLRVLIVLSQQPMETGSGVYLREVVEELQKLGHKPYLLAGHYRPLSTLDFPSLSKEQISTMIFDNGENSEIAEISFPISGMSLVMPYFHLPFRALSEDMLAEYRKAWIAKLQTLIKEIHPHIIHVNHLWLMAGIARSAVPWMPIVATSHGTEYKLLQDSPKFAPLVLPGVQSLDAVMPISTDTASAAVEIMGVNLDRIYLIGNGYNPNMFKILPSRRGKSILQNLLAPFQDLPPWNKLVLYVGKFAEFKGVRYLIRAAEIYNKISQCDIITLIVGEGSKEARSDLENLVEELGLSKRVLLPGKVPYEEVGSLMNMANVFVLPSVDEPFGLVLLEALACGVRSVAAERGGPPFFVPKQLRKKGYVTLVKQLRLLANQQPDPSDEERYINDFAAAISHQLSFQTSKLDKLTIADSMKDQTWELQAQKIVQVYLLAIRLRRLANMKQV
jgi:glycosyltransferase involved in cell wall biosynthesis